MFSTFKLAVIALAAAVSVSAETFVITVGGDEVPNNASTTFTPQRVVAKVNDIVIFNFTNGTHSATQSVFAVPCLPAHDSNVTINGFDSALRPAGNESAITQLSVTITDQNILAPMWFYDEAPGACGLGAVGVINSDENSNETLAGFQRNAIRLNGTAASSSFTPSGSAHGPTGTTPGGASSTTSSSSGAERILVGASGPLAALALVLSML